MMYTCPRCGSSGIDPDGFCRSDVCNPPKPRSYAMVHQDNEGATLKVYHENSLVCSLPLDVGKAGKLIEELWAYMRNAT